MAASHGVRVSMAVVVLITGCGEGPRAREWPVEPAQGPDEDEAEPPRLDLGDAFGAAEVCPPEPVEFSYIWIANSPQGTLAKIDTETMQEVGRYLVRPDGGGWPSRTSVNLHGDVVVASRLGGTTMIRARHGECVDDNGIPGLQTSSGAEDVLAWGEEECVAWHTPYPFLSQRAVAWTPGVLDPVTCEREPAQVWVGGTIDREHLIVLRLDGETGEILDELQIPGTQGYMSRSPYGAAVDADGNLWLVNGYCEGSLTFVDRETLDWQVYAPPPELCAYGVAVDARGYVWVGGFEGWSGRFDPVAETWDLVEVSGLGLQEDGESRIWIGAFGKRGVYAVDADTLEIERYRDLPTSGQSKGVSVDFQGRVWVVSDSNENAVRYDPRTDTYEVFEGLDDPYSYSDMTGWGLRNVIGPPAG